MTTIRATCPCCGEISLTPAQIDLVVDPEDEDTSSYAFTCPECATLVRKPANRQVVRLLVSGGVPARDLVRVRPSVGRPDLPALTPDDLIDFHALLARDGWFDLLLHRARR